MTIALLYALFLLWIVSRNVGARGRARLLALTDERLQAVHQSLTQVSRWWLRIGAVAVVAQNATTGRGSEWLAALLASLPQPSRCR